jgi:hypothetical protein
LEFESEMSLILTMLILRNFFYLAFLGLFFSCQSVEPATEKIAGFVLVEDDENYGGSELSTDDLQNVSLPEIIGLPVEIVTSGIQRVDFRLNEYFIEQPVTFAINHHPEYLFLSRIILPGLRSTEIVYPFHAFW